MESRTAQKLASELRTLVREVQRKLAVLPEDADALAESELKLRDAIAATRRASLLLTPGRVGSRLDPVS